MTLDNPLVALVAALAIGLLIGVERGWQWREASEGTRIAGVRTYALLGLFGGIIGILWRDGGVAVFGVALLAVTIILVTAYALHSSHHNDVSITSAVAAILTFVLGSLATLGYPEIAGAGAGATVVLLGLKPELHHWLQRITRDELKALFKLLLISVVLLPILPNQNYGPWGAWNPYEIWLLVVLIAGLSFAGYIAVRLAGPRRGLLATGVFGGLASSTALTLHFARLARGDGAMTPVLASGILFACSTMFVRMLIIISVLNYTLLPHALPPLAAMATVGLIGAFWQAARLRLVDDQLSPLRNPIELGAALGFGALLSVIIVLTAAFEVWFGDAGIRTLAAISGLADVDAIVVSLARFADAEITRHIAVSGIVIAAAANSLSKAVMASAIGGRRLAYRVIPVLGLMAFVGLATLASPFTTN
ncbi:MgtC/SapB family protein [Aquisalimonas sp.]|uniref:MgtC/SapB family protein n=1 Tax=Aquisalimonas sp. TaxID=1872621 RepID=UPI0025C63D86|nr:MgtC/SapB family protein [Aquisalimonas sp.]